MSRFATALLCSLVFSAAFAAAPARAFWCHGSLVLEGDRAHEIRGRCGEPASIVARTDSRTSYSGGARAGRYGAVYGGVATTITVAIEIWVYDFGPTRFMEELYFEDGVLRRLTRLGRGTRRSELRPEAPATLRWARMPLIERRRVV